MSMKEVAVGRRKEAVGRPLGKDAVGRPLGKKAVGRPLGKEAVGGPLGKEAVGRPLGKEAVGRPLGNEAVYDKSIYYIIYYICVAVGKPLGDADCGGAGFDVPLSRPLLGHVPAVLLALSPQPRLRQLLLGGLVTLLLRVVREDLGGGHIHLHTPNPASESILVDFLKSMLVDFLKSILVDFLTPVTLHRNLWKKVL